MSYKPQLIADRTNWLRGKEYINVSDIGARIWQAPAYLPYLQPVLTDDAIATAEKTIGYTLPAEYLALLRVQNGGYIRLRLPEMVHDSIAGIGPNFPSLTDFDWDDYQEYVSYSLAGLVPFDGDGHWHLCLDYRTNASHPSVTYVDIECDYENPIASSFKDYLSLLRVEIEDEIVVPSVPDIESIKRNLSSLLGADFDATDSWAYGYPVDRAALGSQTDPEWIWLSPNRVPRGFVRPDDDRYNELKDVMPGEALRYPEVPADAYILSATDGVRDKVLNACLECQITVQPLREFIKPK